MYHLLEEYYSWSFVRSKTWCIWDFQPKVNSCATTLLPKCVQGNCLTPEGAGMTPQTEGLALKNSISCRQMGSQESANLSSSRRYHSNTQIPKLSLRHTVENRTPKPESDFPHFCSFSVSLNQICFLVCQFLAWSQVLELSDKSLKR